MVDRLDIEILETIADAPSLVRTVTRREIEAGVLFPSATALDIKRNLPRNITLTLVESRLDSLEREGYIFFNEGRWWLTSKGRKEIGRTMESESSQTQKPVRAIIEETFMKHQPQEEGLSGVLVRLKGVYEDTGLSEEERSMKVKEILSQIGQNRETREYLESRMETLSLEMKELEEKLAKKKAELERIRGLSG